MVGGLGAGPQYINQNPKRKFRMFEAPREIGYIRIDRKSKINEHADEGHETKQDPDNLHILSLGGFDLSIAEALDFRLPRVSILDCYGSRFWIATALDFGLLRVSILFCYGSRF